MFNLVNRARKRNNKGFSLVELIVVVLIIAIIAVALAPQVMKYVGKASDNTDKNNAATLKSAVQTAIADFQADGGVMPTGPSSGTGDGTLVYELTPGANGADGTVAAAASGSTATAPAATTKGLKNTLDKYIEAVTAKDIPAIQTGTATKWKVTITCNAGGTSVKVEKA